MQVTPLVDYHQLYLAPAEVWPEFDVTSAAELMQVMPDRRSLIIRTGIAMGPVSLTVELSDPSDAEHTDRWEQSAEGLLDISEPLVLTAPTVDTGVTSPVFTPPAAGTYHFRLSARGRATHYDRVVDVVTESYLLQLHQAVDTPPSW